MSPELVATDFDRAVVVLVVAEEEDLLRGAVPHAHEVFLESVPVDVVVGPDSERLIQLRNPSPRRRAAELLAAGPHPPDGADRNDALDVPLLGVPPVLHLALGVPEAEGAPPLRLEVAVGA